MSRLQWMEDENYYVKAICVEAAAVFSCVPPPLSPLRKFYKSFERTLLVISE